MKEERLNLKSDVSAKEAFVKLLEQRDYKDIKIISSPADIVAVKDSKKYYFEIKYTAQKKNYFGAATLTEWTAAMDNTDCFWFVVAQKNGEIWKFIEYTPKEFMKFNTIPPFKTYFNISLDNKDKNASNKTKKSIQLSDEKLKRMRDFWNHLKD